MFHVLERAMQSALAPDVPAVVDFRHQWNLFLRFYAEQKQPITHKSQPVEQTRLVRTFELCKLLIYRKLSR